MAINPELISLIKPQDVPNADAKLSDEFFFFEGNKLKKTPISKIPYIQNVTNIINENTYIVDPEQIVPSEALYDDGTLAGDVMKRVNKAAGVDVNYRKSIEAFNGKDITDVLKDKFPTIFKKVGADFFKIQNDGFFNVKMFGAKGDGVTNDSSAFQNAVDFCELFSVKTLMIPYGNFLLNEPVIFNRGGVKIQGQGGFGREESWIGYATAEYPENFPLGVTNTYLGCTITVPKNSTGLVYSDSVVDPVNIDGINFIAKDGRTVGNTNAIDFHATFDGPVWGFDITNCFFRGFNKVVNFESTTQYCVAFVNFSHNSASQNDDILFFADIPLGSVSTLGSRNITWGLNFTHNRCHNNSRLVRGCFAKDLVKIEQNNLEGLIPFADGTYPKNAIDLELYNCTVLLSGNHSEGEIVQNTFFATTYFRKPDGTRHDAAQNVTRGGGCVVELRGNNFDGLTGGDAVVLEGVAVIDYDINYVKKIHGCSILETKSVKPYQLSDDALIETTMFSFPLDSSENVSYFKSNQLSVLGSTDGGIYDKNSVIINTPIGVRQMNKVTNTPALFNYNGIPTRESNSFYGLSYLVNIPSEKDFFGGARFYTNIGNFGNEIACGNIKKGWNIITVLMPKNNRDITSVAIGIELGVLNDKSVLIDPNLTYFTIDKLNEINAAPYFINEVQVFKKQGTFQVGQKFYDDLGVLNIVTKSGTIGEALTVTATGNVGSNFFICTDATKLTTGGYINIVGYDYKIMNIEGDKVYISTPFIVDALNNSSISWVAPIFKTVTLV